MLMHPYTTNWFLTGKAPQRTGNAHPNLCPYSQFATRTKPIFLGVGNDRQFQRFCAEIKRPDLAQDKRFRTNADRVVNRDALHEIIEGGARRRSMAMPCARPSSTAACPAAWCRKCRTFSPIPTPRIAA